MAGDEEEARLAAKLAKRARKAAARAARETAAARARPKRPAPPAPDSVPIIWCEETGQLFYEEGYWCEPCKHRSVLEITAERYESDWPDPRPTIACAKCGQDAPMNSRGKDREYRRLDTGQTFHNSRALPPGACWEMRPIYGSRHNWVSHLDDDGKPFAEADRARLLDRPGPDGRVLIVRLPDGHDWVIDSRASNCTMPNDDTHWCWVRSGRPEDRTLDVGKGGHTCAAGAGSIATGSYHGFLRQGALVRC